MKHQKSAKSGFTIVELLIVVVIIAILAAITLAAFNGIQGRARNSAAQITTNSLVKKMTTYYTLSGSYPTVTTTVITTLATYKESTIDNTSVLIGTPSSSNGTNTLKVELCNSGTGVKITPFDFLTGALSATPISLGTVSSCSTATA